ncbi:hypothetical protein [Neisseria bacilliformis]|nr:hypothetical protein [Neisseria bacilliformis]
MSPRGDARVLCRIHTHALPCQPKPRAWLRPPALAARGRLKT